jgi:hypothetical protein
MKVSVTEGGTVKLNLIRVMLNPIRVRGTHAEHD